jgi:hypothetical protein
MLMFAALLVAFLPDDSLPPLPDPTQVVFPEPPVSMELEPRYLCLYGTAGGRIAAGCTASVRGLEASISFDRHSQWAPCRTYAAAASYSASVTHLAIKPAIRYFREALADTTVLVHPMLDLRLTAPWFVTHGSVAAGRWKIDGRDYNENNGTLGMIFDRAVYLPSLDIAVLQSGTSVKSCWTGSIHISRLHAGVESPLPYGFPSPRLFIAYRRPVLKLEASVKSGVDFRSLNDLYGPERPFHLPDPVPDDSLKIRADLECVFDFIQQRLQFCVTYRNNRTRLVVQDDLSYGTVSMIEEGAAFVKAGNKLAAGIFTGRNSLTGRYAWTSLPILYQPRFELDEQIELRCGSAFVRTAISFLLDRRGVDEMLPDLLLLDLRQCGFTHRWLTIYAAVYNVTDVRKDLYDGYGLSPRSYAGGMAVNFWF